MPGYILMALEGVLCDADEKGPLFAKIDGDGILLYHGLSANFSIVISTLWTNEEEVKHWLMQNGITLKGSNVGRVYVKERPGTTVQVRERHLLALRANGGQVSYVIDADPAVGAMAMRYGVRPLLCPQPVYDSFGLRPDAGEVMATWEEVEAEEELQKSLRGRDLPSRATEEDVISWAERF